LLWPVDLIASFLGHQIFNQRNFNQSTRGGKGGEATSLRDRLPFQYTMTKMVVTVFGGAGKLGQHTLPLLLAAGIEVRCLVRGSAARLGPLASQVDVVGVGSVRQHSASYHRQSWPLESPPPRPPPTLTFNSQCAPTPIEPCLSCASLQLLGGRGRPRSGHVRGCLRGGPRRPLHANAAAHGPRLCTSPRRRHKRCH